jgi:uncharacterized membrane protein
MMRLVFWLFTAAVLAVAAHAATLLFAPRYTFERSLAGALDAASNSFAVLTPEAQRRLLPDYPDDAVFGICRFDLNGGPVTLTADLPDRFWVLAVYSSGGKTLYTVNDRQSGVNNFTLRLVRAPGLLETFTARDDEDAVSDLAYKVASPDRKGLALVWVPLSDAAQRQSLAASIAKTSCARS